MHNVRGDRYGKASPRDGNQMWARTAHQQVVQSLAKTKTRNLQGKDPLSGKKLPKM